MPEETSRLAPIGNQDSIFSIAALAALQTYVGRSCHTRNLEDLFICECGSPVLKVEIDAKVNVIQCKKTDCETRWMSSKFYQFLINSAHQTVTDPPLPVPSGMYWPGDSESRGELGMPSLQRRGHSSKKNGID